jgi:hypothetical protein
MSNCADDTSALLKAKNVQTHFGRDFLPPLCGWERRLK